MAGRPAMLAAQWPWGKPDTVTAQCSVDRAEVERGSPTPLRATVEATDSRKHPLAYAWSANGGKVLGKGPEVEIDTSELGLGVYSVAAVAQDSSRNSASCVASFQVVRPKNQIALTCKAESEVVEAGSEAVLLAEGSEKLGHALHYEWYANGGTLQKEGPRARLQTEGLRPGVYTVTGRAEDGLGAASDCTVLLTVELPTPPPPPPVPPEPVGIARIVFSLHRAAMEGSGSEQLREVLARLREDPQGRISVEAYAGPEEKNPQQLAGERAATVRRFLLENGVEESRVDTVIGVGGGRGGLRNRTLDIIWLPDGLEY